LFGLKIATNGFDKLNPQAESAISRSRISNYQLKILGAIVAEN